MTGSKVVLREAADLLEDYDAHHALRRFKYTDKFQPQRLYSFGATKHGSQFTAVDAAPYSPETMRGWLGSPALEIVSGAPEGAYYSALAGRDATFRLSGLAPGVHFATVACGNYAGHPNSFSVTANGREFIPATSVAQAELLSATLPIWIGADGILDLQFQGDFLVSAIGDFHLLAQAEDFSFNRGIWVSEGYEPAAIYRNEHYRPSPVLKPFQQRLRLPVPGQEAAGPARPIDRPVELPDPDSPGLAWTRNPKIRPLSGNMSILNEFHDPATLDRRLETLKREGATVIMVSGLHSRHTYPGSLRRGLDVIRDVIQAAHQKGLKVIDHHDATLVWNIDAGFRVLSERVGESVQGLVDLMPNPSFCILNPKFTRTYRDYLLESVRNGVDGFQPDEVTFYSYGCGCRHCREAFRRDTGWELPMNECDPRLNNRDDPLWKTFLEWRKAKVANWWVEFRREAKAINPDLVLSNYTTHYGFTSDYGSLGMGADITEMARAGNFFGTEIMTRNCLQSARSLLPYRRMNNLLHLAYGAPIFAFIYGSNHATLYFGWAACNMNGQSGLAVLPANAKGPDFFAFETSPDNMDRGKAESIAKIAILFSSHCRDWQFGTSVIAEAFGCAQTLEEIHAPYDIVGDAALLNHQLGKYSVLFIGSSACLSDQQISDIRDFAQNGGTVYLATLAAMGDELGNRRSQWPFADIFGFTPAMPGKPAIVKLGTTPDEARARPIAQPLGAFISPDTVAAADSPLYLFDAAGRALPALVARSHGKGRILYQTASLPGELFASEGVTNMTWEFELDETLASFCREYYGTVFADALHWRTNAPAKVYTSLYRQGDATVIHFLNAAGANLKKGETMSAAAPGPAWPELQEDITFTIPCKKAEEVHAVSPDFPDRQLLPFTIKDGELTATLPKSMLHAYTIVWIR